MENFISQILTLKVPAEHIVKFTVPQGGIKAGQVVLCNDLDSSIYGNYEVYTAEQPATAKLGSTNVAIVINDGIEELADGRRPAGQPNYYQYEFKAGDTAYGIFLDRHLVFNIGENTLDSATKANAAVGKFLYMVDGSNNLTVGDSIPAGTATGLKIVAKYSTPVGGMSGGQFANSFICVAQ